MIKRTLQFAKTMRSHPTDAEGALWKQLRAGRFSGFKFKRQQPIGTYIVDFVCFDRKVIVEIDGGQHDDIVDRVRTSWLQSRGFLVARFWNDEVLKQQDDVLTAILKVLSGSAPSPQPLSREGRGAKAVLPSAEWEEGLKRRAN